MGTATFVPAEISSIERELRRQWEAHALHENAACARTLNLIVISHPKETPAPLIEQLAQGHPCRAIVLTFDGETGRIRAEVTSSYGPALPGETCLLREEVRLRLPGHLQHDWAESVVVPLLVPDLPVFLWWNGRPELKSPLFSCLAKHAHRIILDSDEFENVWAGLLEIQQVIAGPLRHAVVTDLAWARITWWRELTAQFFDNRRCASLPPRITAARLVLGKGPVPSDAILFAAWVARQLGWKAHRAEVVAPAASIASCRWLLEKDGARYIEFQIHPEASSGLQSVELHIEGEETSLFRIEEAARQSSLTTITRLQAGQQIQRTVRRPALGLAELLGQELSLLVRDNLYEHVLATAVELAPAAREGGAGRER